MLPFLGSWDGDCSVLTLVKGKDVVKCDKDQVAVFEELGYKKPAPATASQESESEAPAKSKGSAK